MKDNSAMDRVKAMRHRFGLSYGGTPRALNADQRLQQSTFLYEEVQEFIHATEVVSQYDAMLDLIVFALGTIEHMGLPFQDGFDAVMDANMAKVRGDKGRGTKMDLIKPPGWEGPERKLAAVCNAWGEPQQLELPFPDQVDMSKPQKFDEGKPRLSLLPLEVLTSVAQVLEYGANKYSDNNWRSDPDVGSLSKWSSSALRHFLSWIAGEDIDPESKLHHIDHAICQLMFLRYFLIEGWGEDFRNDE